MEKIKPLEPPDSFHLQAAQGWVELGSHLEADAELDLIAAKLRVHPDVLEVRWQIYAKAGQWEGCIFVAKAITSLAPDRAIGWINLSFALHELKRTKEALENLVGVAETFSKEPTILYNLACYCCCLGQLSEARRLLKKAFRYGEAKSMKLMALNDPDLEPLRAELRE